MLETGPVRIVLDGDQTIGRQFINQARMLLGATKSLMRFQELQQLYRRFSLPDGVLIEVQSVFGIDMVQITIPPGVTSQPSIEHGSQRVIRWYGAMSSAAGQDAFLKDLRYALSLNQSLSAASVDAYTLLPAQIPSPLVLATSLRSRSYIGLVDALQFVKDGSQPNLESLDGAQALPWYRAVKQPLCFGVYPAVSLTNQQITPSESPLDADGHRAMQSETRATQLSGWFMSSAGINFITLATGLATSLRTLTTLGTLPETATTLFAGDPVVRPVNGRDGHYDGEVSIHVDGPSSGTPPIVVDTAWTYSQGFFGDDTAGADTGIYIVSLGAGGADQPFSVVAPDGSVYAVYVKDTGSYHATSHLNLGQYWAVIESSGLLTANAWPIPDAGDLSVSNQIWMAGKFASPVSASSGASAKVEVIITDDLQNTVYPEFYFPAGTVAAITATYNKFFITGIVASASRHAFHFTYCAAPARVTGMGDWGPSLDYPTYLVTVGKDGAYSEKLLYASLDSADPGIKQWVQNFSVAYPQLAAPYVCLEVGGVIMHTTGSLVSLLDINTLQTGFGEGLSDVISAEFSADTVEAIVGTKNVYALTPNPIHKCVTKFTRANDGSFVVTNTTTPLPLFNAESFLQSQRLNTGEPVAN